MKGKYAALSIAEIESKVEAGIFSEDLNSRVIRDEKQSIVRFLERPATEISPNNSYYNQYVQVVNNYVTYTDTNAIIKGMLDISNQRVFLELSESHKISINFLKQYQNTKNPNIVQKLNESTLEAISKYQIKLKEYFRTNLKDMDQELLLNSCRSYLDLIKIYKLSSYWYHQNNTLDYFEVIDFLDDIFKQMQQLFENIICPLGWREEVITIDSLSKSMYMKFFLSQNTENIEKYSYIDSRLGSTQKAYSYISSSFSKRNYYDIRDSSFPTRADEEFAKKLYDILCDYKELYNFNALFNPDQDIVLVNEQNLKNILLPASNK
jgi:hypothetical protein